MRHTRPPYRVRIRWRRWMPWYEASRQIGEWQAHNEDAEGLPLVALGVALAALLLTLLLPAPRTILRLGAQAAHEDARVLWHGRTALTAAPAPTLLLEGEIVSGGTDDDGTDRPTTDWKEGEVDQ